MHICVYMLSNYHIHYIEVKWTCRVGNRRLLHGNTWLCSIHKCMKNLEYNYLSINYAKLPNC